MKWISALVLSLLTTFSTFADSGTFTITSLGISDSSKTVYIGVNPDVPNSTCTRKDQIRVHIINSDIADEVYSAALVAITTDRQIAMDYDPTICLNGATQIGTFSISAN